MIDTRVIFLTLISLIVAITVVGLGCNSTQSPMATAVQVEESYVPQPTKPIERPPITGFVIHGETGTTEWWCEDEYCYKSTTEKWADEKCLRVERIPQFDATDLTKSEDQIKRLISLIEELIAKGKSTPCKNTGPSSLLPQHTMPEHDSGQLTRA